MKEGTYHSVPGLFRARVQDSPDALAFQFPVGERDWGRLTWQQTDDRVRALAGALLARGQQVEGRCAIIASTRIEWILADLGVMAAGGATTTVYPSSTPEECAFILGDSQCRFVFAEDPGQVAKLEEVRDQLPGVEQVIVFEGPGTPDGWVRTLADFEAEGRRWNEAHPGEIDRVIDGLTLQQLATLIYTSGTTGQPKGVELLHDAWVFQADTIDAVDLLHMDDHQYLWLPLSHSFGKMLQVMQLKMGFPTTVDGRIPKLVENLAVVRPTFMAAAPRIFEKVYARIVAMAMEGGAVKHRIFSWATEVGLKVGQLRQKNVEPGPALALQYALADKLVFRKIRDRFGGRLRFFISGSAPLSREIAEFFYAAGVIILEGYGLTETSAAVCVNLPDRLRLGTVGPMLPDVQAKIAEDGEILLKGRSVMRGYHGLPEATEEVLPGDGWLRTGDIGEMDADGFLRITDRKKDLIKTSGGKYVAPQKLEVKFKALCPYCSQILVHGNNRNFVTALVTLDPETIGGWAREHDLEGADLARISRDPRLVAMVKDAIDRLNAELASYETVKKFAVLDRDFTLEEGELTPSGKVKRKAVEARYKDVLDGFYGEPGRRG